MGPAVRTRPGGIRDAWVAATALAVVVAASVLMERAASSLGQTWAVPEIVVGGLVLAAVTSLPNAVAAVYLAARGKGSAALSTAVTSNNLNVAIGLLVPGTFLGLGAPSGQTTLVTAWYIGLTAFTLLIAYRGRGLRRTDGLVIIGAYAVFVGSVLATAPATSMDPRLTIAPALVVAAVISSRLVVIHGTPVPSRSPSRARHARCDCHLPVGSSSARNQPWRHAVGLDGKQDLGGEFRSVRSCRGGRRHHRRASHPDRAARAGTVLRRAHSSFVPDSDLGNRGSWPRSAPRCPGRHLGNGHPPDVHRRCARGGRGQRLWSIRCRAPGFAALSLRYQRPP